MIFLLAACNKSTSPPPPAPEPTRVEAPTAPAWVGTWSAEPCGERAYSRNLTLRQGGAATLEERISPCPPDAMCVWSGIVVIEGTWKADGRTATLDFAVPDNGHALSSVPTTLTWEGVPAQGVCRYSLRTL